MGGACCARDRGGAKPGAADPAPRAELPPPCAAPGPPVALCCSSWASAGRVPATFCLSSVSAAVPGTGLLRPLVVPGSGHSTPPHQWSLPTPACSAPCSRSAIHSLSYPLSAVPRFFAVSALECDEAWRGEPLHPALTLLPSIPLPLSDPTPHPYSEQPGRPLDPQLSMLDGFTEPGGPQSPEEVLKEGLTPRSQRSGRGALCSPPFPSTCKLDLPFSDPRALWLSSSFQVQGHNPTPPAQAPLRNPKFFQHPAVHETSCLDDRNPGS